MKDMQMVQAMGFDRHFKATSWEEGNRSFFDQLARKYDRLNEVISLGQQKAYKYAVVRDLELRPRMRVLDVCTGTGDLAIMMARQCKGLAIDAVDVSEPMLAIAREKAAKDGFGSIRFNTGDALALPFADNTFDAVMMGFGLRNFKSIPAGLEEVYRVLKPSGRFISLDLGKPRGWSRPLYHVYYETLMPWLGQVLFHRGEFNSYAYLSTSNKYFPPPQEILGMMAEVGFKKLRGKEYMFGGLAQQIGEK